MAIAIALRGFNDLEHSVTPTFLTRNRFYLQLSPHCPKMDKKSMWEVKKIHLIAPLKQYLAENISLKRSNCSIFGLTDTVATFALRNPIFSDLGCSSRHVLSKMKFVTPPFFCLFGKSRSLSFCVASLKKSVCGNILGTNVLNLSIFEQKFILGVGRAM